MNYKCRYCKARMQAFIHGELDLKARRRVAQHLDECPLCYKEHLQKRELADKLAARVPLLGKSKPPQLQKIWNAVQRDLQPRPKQHQVPSARYGVAALILVVAMLLPLTLGNSNIALSAPTHPIPSTAGTRTPSDATVVTVALMVTDKIDSTPNLALHNTPEPGAIR